MDRVRQMQVFVQVMENGNFTQAAAALAMPRSTVSATIQALEDRLGAQLFSRSTRSMTPTDDARRLLPRAREIVEAVGDVDAMFRSGDDRISGRLRVGMPTRIGNRVVVPALPALLDASPGLRIELSCTDRISNLIGEGFDCLVRVGALHDAEIVCRKIGDLPLVTCASPDYLARRGVPEGPDDLADHLLVEHESRLPVGAATFEHAAEGRAVATPMPCRMRVSNGETCIAAALAGLGLIQVPAFDVRDLIAQGRLVAVLPALSPPPMQLSLLHAQRRNVPARIRLFQNWLVEVLGEAGVLAGPLHPEGNAPQG